MVNHFVAMGEMRIKATNPDTTVQILLLTNPMILPCLTNTGRNHPQVGTGGAGLSQSQHVRVRLCAVCQR